MKITSLHKKDSHLTLTVLLVIAAACGFCKSTVTKQPVKHKSHAEAGTAASRNNNPLFNGIFYYGLPFERNLGVRFVNNGKAESDIYEGLRWNSTQRSFSHSVRSIIIDGDCSVEFSCLDINEQNAADYRYRVMKNNNEGLANWIKPSVFIYSPDRKLKYAYLGHFNYAPGQVLKVEIFNVKSNFLKDGMLIGWLKIEPAQVFGVFEYTSGELHFPNYELISVEMNRLKKTGAKYGKPANSKQAIFERPDDKDFIETKSVNDIKFRLADSLQNLHFYVGENWPRLYNYTIVLKREVNGKTDSSSLGETDALGETETAHRSNGFDFNKKFWNYPGKYKLTFIPNIIKMGDRPSKKVNDLAATISFTVLPAKDESVQLKVKTLIFIGFLTISIAVIISAYYIRQKVLLAKETQNRETAVLQLQSIRSQLNPHFIFNALAGIQNLMNKNEVENANKYLARFARLTRNVLDDNHKELTSIDHEIALLTDYLQMEQMRFGFNFNIIFDSNDIDQQIEIPAMLLQPFVENAVKHGVASLKDKGVITINIVKIENNLLMSVQDNGKGYKEGQPAGIGFKLCEDRIRLLNSIYKNSAIVLHKNPGTKGTLVTIELKSWL